MKVEHLFGIALLLLTAYLTFLVIHVALKDKLKLDKGVSVSIYLGAIPFLLTSMAVAVEPHYLGELVAMVSK